MRDIDGSYGEGGGQLLRTACALAAITGEAVRLHHIRARRAPPGLAPQHLTAVRAVAALCEARVEGLALRSPELSFHPGKLRGGEFHFDVGTAGSVTLVLQALLPAALHAGAPVRIQLAGGTDVRAAPALDYLRHILLPLLAQMGAEVQLTLRRRGYYPRGGGLVEVVVQPRGLRGLRLDVAGPVRQIHGIAHVSNLPTHIAARLRETAARLLADIAPVDIEQQILGRDQATGQGGAIVLWARTDHALLGSSEVAQRGVPAERIAGAAAQALREDILAGATLDLHASDQLLIYCALARGRSSFRARTLSSHAQTTLWLLQQFLPLRAGSLAAGGATRVDIEPG
ncbi:MAG TPA: RNA 3'-terminal phosphate cyclase [Sulfuricaulis sp.]|nr:RNA 3'-terminal phosphate cyclase [Sulfuricaulis sp.]